MSLGLGLKFLLLVTIFEVVVGGGGEVTLYPDFYYRGEPRTIWLTKNCFPLFGRLGQDVSSIRVGENCIQIYRSHDCAGDFKVLDGINKNLGYLTSDSLNSIGMNDQVLSLKLCD